MRSIFAIVVCVLFFSSCLVNVQATKDSNKAVLQPELDLCPDCVELLANVEDELMQVILNGGVLGSCNALCGNLSTAEAFICNLLCDYVGITAFIKAIDYEDPDPIYTCQEIYACPIVNNGAATVVSTSVSPQSGPTGTTFDVTFIYKVTSPLGPGLVEIGIIDPQGNPLGDSEFSEGAAVGEYKAEWSLQTQPSEQESFGPGEYQVFIDICAGDCTTDHPYGGIYVQGAVNFTITGK